MYTLLDAREDSGGQEFLKKAWRKSYAERAEESGVPKTIRRNVDRRIGGE